MSNFPEQESERDGDEEKETEDFEIVEMPDEKNTKQDQDSDDDIEPFQPVPDTENMTEPPYSQFQPMDPDASNTDDQKENKKSEEVASTSKIETQNENQPKNDEEVYELPDIMPLDITPQMIVAALKRLQYLKYTLSLDEIMGYISRHFPVQSNKDELRNELSTKLRCAVHLGFVKEINGRFRLTVDREKLHLKKSELRAFWESYVKNPKNVREIASNSDSQTNEENPRRSQRLQGQRTAQKRKREQNPKTRAKDRKVTSSKIKRRKKNSYTSNSKTSSYDERPPRGNASRRHLPGSSRGRSRSSSRSSTP